MARDRLIWNNQALSSINFGEILMTRRNLITDIPGLSVGQAHDRALASGVSVVLFDDPATVGVSVLGGAAAGRDLAALAPDSTVQGVNALVLSGGSGFGLDAASGVQAWFARARGPASGSAQR